MSKKDNTLDRLGPGHTAYIKQLNFDGLPRRRMQDLGLTDGATITALWRSPFGDPTAYHIRGAVIAIRQEEACRVVIDRPEKQ